MEPWLTRYFFLQGDKRYRYRSRFALCFAALFDDTLGAHLEPRKTTSFQGICWFTKLRWLRKPPAFVKLGPHCQFVWLLNPGNKNCRYLCCKCLLSRKRINICTGWKHFCCAWWFRVTTSNHLSTSRATSAFVVFFSEDPNLALVLDRDIGQILENERLVISSPVGKDKKTKAT